MTTQAWQTINVTEDRYRPQERLDVFVIRHWDSVCDMPISRSKVSAAIKAQQIMLSDRKAKSHDHVAVGDQVQISSVALPKVAQITPDESVQFSVIFTCDDFYIIDKPAGLQVHPALEDDKQTLVHGLLALDVQIAQVGEDILRPGIVHRLDRDTSGLMVVARNQETFVKFKELFSTRKVTKKYIALVRGKLPAEGEIHFPIARSSAGNRQVAVRGRIRYRGTVREAHTEYRTLRKIQTTDNFGDEVIYSLAEVRIYTGRTHQIRVHMRAIGHPVVGDKLYGPRKAHNQFAHQFLHAQSLAFTLDSIDYSFATSVPADWRGILEPI